MGLSNMVNGILMVTVVGTVVMALIVDAIVLVWWMRR
jgi:hypothetical protein